MSGHNKWSKVKHKKAATDAKKSREFSKLIHELQAAIREAGGNPDAASVQTVIDRAKAINMPKENIQRAIKRATGAGANLETVTYETYGPGGVAIIISAQTDNKNRTGAEIKKLLSDHGAELASPGAATWAFTKTADAWQANQTVPLGEEDTEKLTALTQALEEHEDVDAVYTNAL